MKVQNEQEMNHSQTSDSQQQAKIHKTGTLLKRSSNDPSKWKRKTFTLSFVPTKHYFVLSSQSKGKVCWVCFKMCTHWTLGNIIHYSGPMCFSNCSRSTNNKRILFYSYSPRDSKETRRAVSLCRIYPGNEWVVISYWTCFTDFTEHGRLVEIGFSLGAFLF